MSLSDWPFNCKKCNTSLPSGEAAALHEKGCRPYLQPCPFCGERIVLEIVDLVGEAGRAVMCQKCGGRGPGTQGTDIEAAMHWNRRAV